MIVIGNKLVTIVIELRKNERSMRERYVKSLLDMIILQLIKGTPSCGFDIITFINNYFNILLSPGTIYPLLSTLEKCGLIKHKNEKRYKIYALTKKGEKHIRSMMNDYMQVHKQCLSLSKQSVLSWIHMRR
ncbi:MAG: PadR family transcriptional regulator [Methanocellales archaeon]|nr:PadR family transcriptional regulator [Methanocellales archaeon]